LQPQGIFNQGYAFKTGINCVLMLQRVITEISEVLLVKAS